MPERIELHKRPDGRWLVRRISDDTRSTDFEWVFPTRREAVDAADVISEEIEDEANKAKGARPCGQRSD